MKKKTNPVKPLIDTAVEIEKTAEKVSEAADRAVEPYRKSAFRRFPVLFLLLVALGVSAVFYGFELIIEGIPGLVERPFLVLGVGIVILTITGTLYKKLG